MQDFGILHRAPSPIIDKYGGQFDSAPKESALTIHVMYRGRLPLTRYALLCFPDRAKYCQAICFESLIGTPNCSLHADYSFFRCYRMSWENKYGSIFVS